MNLKSRALVAVNKYFKGPIFCRRQFLLQGSVKKHANFVLNVGDKHIYLMGVYVWFAGNAGNSNCNFGLIARNYISRKPF